MPYYHKEMKKYFQQILKNIEKSIYRPVGKLNVTAYWSREPLAYKQRTKGKKLSLKEGQKWGNLFDCAWFHFTGTIPTSAQAKSVVLLIDVNGEACVYDKSGNPILGLTNVSSVYDYNLGTPGKRIVPLTKNATGKEKIDIWADAGCNDLFGVLQGNGTLKEATIAICNDAMRKLYYDYEVLYELMTLIPEEKARHHTILYALNQAANALTDYTDEEAKFAQILLSEELKKKNGTPSLTVSAIGHAHIDLGWLWPIRETIRKGARTFSTVLEMMKRYPDYKFGASQAQLYQWMKVQYPALYQQIKKKVREGRWELQGCTWVEADINIPGGEALVRQILYGKRFFQQEFGKEMKILWQPDVFGYIASLPQLLKKSNVDYFMTQKLSWSLYNQFPHHTFHWQGIDGSRVLAHMPPENTYNSSAAPRAIYHAEKNFIDKSVSDRVLLLFGIGDGGGGPGEEHLERLIREKNLDGLAPVNQETAEKFFKRIEKDKNKYHTWMGELYLERHQGTLTTQARNKRYNRKLEIALRELEWSLERNRTFSTFGYPKKELDVIWKEVMLYQFHDILPGSSITRVYHESLERYKILMEKVNQLQKKADSLFLKNINTKNTKNPVILTNSLSWERSEWIKTGNQWVNVKVPAMGYTTIDSSKKERSKPVIIVTSLLLENEILRIVFNKDGSILSIFDKDYRKEILPKDQTGNLLQVYDDPGDAWDFPIHYDEKKTDRFKLVSTKFKKDGPCGIIQHLYKCGKSRLEQEIILKSGSRRIDFVTRVDWKETHKMLRTSFPVNLNTLDAACDIQFGWIKRPTHRSTSWDMGKFEICAHKYIDISQEDYGVALLNDCKYGHKIAGNILDINLLRSPTYPDPLAERARHEFTYSLYPHPGNHLTGGVIQAGYELNYPLRRLITTSHHGKLIPEFSFFRVEPENIILETVKKAEQSGDRILRLYESHGKTTRARIQSTFPLKSVQLMNLMEEKPEKLQFHKNMIELNFNPFEIQTLKLS